MSTQKSNKDQLGKGIRSLLQSIDTDLKTTSGQLKPSVVENVTSSSRIAVEEIEPNPKQPRHDFDENALKELATSIKLHDIIQPITVSKLTSGKYRLISGERRWRAAKMAGLKDIPAFVRQANDQQLLELALLENLQREDLNAMEVALSYKRMMDELEYTQEQVADRMGKDRSTVANIIRLLRLPPDIQLSVRRGELSMGHARALIALDVVDAQLVAFKEILSKGLSVRQTEALVQQLKKSLPAVKKTTNSTSSSPYKRIEDKLASHFSTRVKIKTNKDGSGQLVIEYYTQEEFNKILKLLNAPLD
ncbi:MAG: ParB/RepB/Spo0J family partition protein [Chitinophagaceae bacterium]|jgi:ParB family transcriptional regulator, chromosome partitioning protein|nr:ParB/RepB/Spo0J family partition protein [Chitinophagia bacterium]NDB52594.1 ParB/RepB/Spo0J family partition protein [Chitinophagaceae bacterium]NDE77592.1 ParB/RepB/Spo0J family partition protein [Chitinophagaceae bacterium]HAL95392.1 chromosome partitioning protein ParB [Chitinophagaceae bacterium]